MADFTVHCGPQNTNYCDHCGIGDGDVPIFRINPSKTILIWICALCLQEAYGSALIEIDNLITELEKLNYTTILFEDELYNDLGPSYC